MAIISNNLSKKLGRAVSLLALAFIASFVTFMARAALPGPTSASFAKGVKFTVAGYTGSSTLSGFPVLVRIAENSPYGFSYDDLHSKSDGDDIAFVDMDGGGLSYEIDTWNTNGTSLVWVCLPSMTNGTEFVMCWGSDKSGKTVCFDSPFAGYVGVWHMSEPSGTVVDSSGHSLDAEPTGAGAETLSIAVSGPVGNGRQCSNSTSIRSYLKVPSYNSQNVGNTFAVSGWFNVGSGQSAKDARLFSRKTYYTEANGWEVVWKKSGEFSTRGASSTADAKYTPNPSFGSGWKHFFIVYDNKASTIYENGVQKAQKTDGAAATDNNVALGIGDYPEDSNLAPLVGSVDECRLLDAVPSADWAKAEYDSMSNAVFLTAGTAEEYAVNNAPLADLRVSDVSYTNATVTVTITSRGTGAASADVTIELAVSNDFASPLWTTQYTVSEDNDVRAFSPPDLMFGTTYYVRAVVSNNLAAVLTTLPASLTTPAPNPVFSACVDTDHIAPDILLSFNSVGLGSTVTSITLQVATSADFSTIALAKTLSVDLAAMPTNVSDIVLTGLPTASPLYYRFTTVNSDGYAATVDVEADNPVGDGNNVWSGLSEDIDADDAYVFAGGLPASNKTLYFTTLAGLSPVINRDVVMPLLRFTSGTNETFDASYLGGYYSCGYDLSGTGVLTFDAEKPILHASKGTNVVRNPILFNRANNKTVYVSSCGGRLDLTGELMLPEGVTNTTMRVGDPSWNNGELHFGGPSPDFMGRLYLEHNFTLSLDNPNAMTNVSSVYFGEGWGSFTYLKNNTGAPMTFPRCAKISNATGWSCTRTCYAGAPLIFPCASLVWCPRETTGSTTDADLVVNSLQVAKHGSNGSAVFDKVGAGTMAVMGTTSWDTNACKHFIRLYRGCFWAQTEAGLPPSGEFYVPNDHAWQSTIGLSFDFYPTLDGSSTPRVFQSSKWATWGFTGFGGERTVCWNADPTLNLTNTTGGTVSIPLGDDAHTNVLGKAYSDYYAYPIYFVFGNRSEFADGTILFLNPIRYELGGQEWDTKTIFESTNHVVAARLRGSLKLGSANKTWTFTGRDFGGYLALEADNADFTGKVNVTEKGNLLVNSNLVARSVTVQAGSGLGGTGELSTTGTDGTTVNSGGSLFGGEWNKGGVLTLNGKITLKGGAAIRVEVGASNDNIGCIKLAAGSTLDLTAPVYVDVDTDPRVSPDRGVSRKILDWSEVFPDPASAPSRANFVARPERNPDLRRISVSIRDDGLYVGYISVRSSSATIMTLR